MDAIVALQKLIKVETTMLMIISMSQGNEGTPNR
jgi:hypothetical protein